VSFLGFINLTVILIEVVSYPFLAGIKNSSSMIKFVDLADLSFKPRKLPLGMLHFPTFLNEIGTITI